MLEHIHLERILFLDIETVPNYPDLSELPSKTRELWQLKAEQIKNSAGTDVPGELYHRAGIYAEFGRIVCVSTGYFSFNEDKSLVFRIKSFSGKDEKALLINLADLLEEHFLPGKYFLCAHNGKEFDFPYIARRLLINDLKIPACLDIAGKKPWETDHLLDTMYLWRFGDFKNYTSLDLLCAVFNIPSPKNNISGKDIWSVFWIENDLIKITHYCEQDVLAMARLMLKFKGMKAIPDENVIYINQ